MEFTHDEHCTCPGCLTWASYDTMYVDFAMEYSQQMLTYRTVAVQVLNKPADRLMFGPHRADAIPQ